MNLVEDIIDNADITLLKESISSGHYTMGEKIKNFENEFSKKFNFNYLIII